MVDGTCWITGRGGGGAASSLKNLSIEPGSLPWIDGKCTPTAAVAGILARLEAAGANWLAGSRVLQLKSADADAVPLELQGVGTCLTTPAAQNLTIVPGAGGITHIGAGTCTLGAPTNDDAYINGRLQMGNNIEFKSWPSSIVWPSGRTIEGVSANKISFGAWTITELPPKVYVGGSSGTYPGCAYVASGADFAFNIWGNVGDDLIHFVSQPNRADDYNQAAAANPILRGYSATAAATATDQWWGLQHDTNHVQALAGKGKWTFADGLRTKVDTSDVSSPPTDAELDAAFGTPATVGSGFLALVDDAGAGAAVWVVASDGTNWWYAAMTKAT